ncbi:pyruvate dehydrogenase (acetyl-transferring) kinase, mitochondrial [Tanacetum coccineum]
MRINESLNVTFDETPPPFKTSPLVDDELDEEEAIKVTKKKNLENDIRDKTLEIDEIVNIKESRNHPLENVIGNLNQITLRMLSNIMVLEETNALAISMTEAEYDKKNGVFVRLALLALLYKSSKTSSSWDKLVVRVGSFPRVEGYRGNGLWERVRDSCRGTWDSAANRWLRNEPSGSIITWEILKNKFLSKYCPPARTAKKMEEINNFQQEPDETLYQAWERFKELFTKGAIPSMKAADAKKAIRDMADHSQKWHNEMSTMTRIGCESCNRPHYTKDCPLKEEGKTFEEAYYTQFRVSFPQGGRYRAAAPGFYQRENGNPSYQERRQTMEESLSKFMAESAKRHDDNSNLIKEIQATTDAAISN